MGKLFSEQMWIFQEAGTATSPWASAASLTEARHEASLPLVALSSAPLSQILSSAKSGLAMTLVLACICSLFRVTLIESLIGRISFSSLLPPVIGKVSEFVRYILLDSQYLMTAMLTGAVHVTMGEAMLDCLM